MTCFSSRYCRDYVWIILGILIQRQTWFSPAVSLKTWRQIYFFIRSINSDFFMHSSVEWMWRLQINVTTGHQLGQLLLTMKSYCDLKPCACYFTHQIIFVYSPAKPALFFVSSPKRFIHCALCKQTSAVHCSQWSRSVSSSVTVSGDLTNHLQTGKADW